MNFSELNLADDLMKGITDAGFTTLMPVQAETLPHSLAGKDITVQSQTGTGKTAIFLITIFQHFLDKECKKNKKALILAPTRELAVQIENDALLLGRYLPFSIGCFYGGIGYHQQEKQLEKGVDIIIGTPGRLIDFNNQKKVDFKDIGFLVIDEADRMFDMGFLPDIRRILRKTSYAENRQTMLFSATLDGDTRSIAREFMIDAVTIAITPEQVTVDKITQSIYHVANKEKLNLMLGILKKEAPKNALIFTNTKEAASQVAKHLEFNGYRCLHISGDLPQKKRLQVIEDFKSGELPFLVATDVAARGLHVDGLEMIFNYDLPGDCENYVHRIGRTARAGKSGIAVSLACEDYIYNLDAIEKLIGMKIPVAFADDSLFAISKSEGMTFKTFKHKKISDREPHRLLKKTPSSFKTAATHLKPKREKKLFAKAEELQSKNGDEMTTTKKDDKPLEKTDAKKTGKKEEKKKTFKEKKPVEKKEHKPKQKPDTSTTPDDQKKPKTRTYNRKKPSTSTVTYASEEERLAYYKKKYGDNFKLPADDASPKPQPEKSPEKPLKTEKLDPQPPTIKKEDSQPDTPKPSFMQRVLNIFKKKS